MARPGKRSVPADHPEFFRAPAPQGRSRESRIALDEQGRFWHEGKLVEHPGMARAFATWIDRHPDDGRFILNNGFDWVYFQVADAPFLVRGIRDVSGHPFLLLSDGSLEELDPRALELGTADALYVRVKGERFRARFTPAAQLGLAPWLGLDPSGAISLQIAGRSYGIGGLGPGS